MPVSGEYQVKIKGEARTAKKAKTKAAPKGGGFAAQAKRSAVNQDYAGIPKALKPKVTVIIKGNSIK